jgi:site-specific DNA recombinase
MMSIINVFAQFEREQSAERTKHKMVSIAAKGEWPVGKPPFGYKRGDKHDNVLQVDPRNAEIVKDVFTMYTGSFQTLDIAKKYKETICRQTILNILRNKAYVGKVVYDGNEYDGKHEAIISDELFEKAQAKLPRPSQFNKNRPKSQKYPYVLTGLVHCHCGRFMTPASMKSGKFHYYRCTDNIHCKNYVSAPSLQAAVLEKINSLVFNKKLIAEITDGIDKKKIEFLKKQKPIVSNASRAIIDVNVEINKIESAFMSGLVTAQNKEHWNNKLEKLLEEKKELELKKES